MRDVVGGILCSLWLINDPRAPKDFAISGMRNPVVLPNPWSSRCWQKKSVDLNSEESLERENAGAARTILTASEFFSSFIMESMTFASRKAFSPAASK